MRYQTNFLKICFPLSLGSIILPTATKQFLFKILFFGSWTLPFVTAKRILALSIFHAKPPLKIKMGDMLGSVCHTVFYRMHFGFHLHISAMLLSSFCWKVDFALRCHIALIHEARTACKICRIHVAMMSSPWNRGLRLACFHSPACRFCRA